MLILVLPPGGSIELHLVGPVLNEDKKRLLSAQVSLNCQYFMEFVGFSIHPQAHLKSV